MRIFLTLVLAILLLGTTGSASAYPYQLFAKYSVNATEAGKPASVDRIELAAFNPEPATTDTPQRSAFVPANVTNGEFLGIFLTPKTDGVAKLELDRLDAIYVDVCAVGATCERPLAHKRIGATSLAEGKEELVLFPGNLAGHDPVAKLFIEVRLHFKGEYLCELETTLRKQSGKPVLIGPAKPVTLTEKSAGAKPTLAGGIQLDATNASVLKLSDGNIDLQSYGILFDQGLTNSQGKALIYSYCTSVYRAINWDEVKKYRPGDDDPHKTDKAALAKKLLPTLNEDETYGSVRQRVYARAEPAEQSENTYGEFGHYASLVRNLPGVTFVETGEGELAHVVDKSSQIEMRVDSNFCDYLDNCNVIVGTKLSAEVQYTATDKEDATETSVLKPNGRGWVITSDLEKHIRDTIKIRVYYTLDNASRIGILESADKVVVENLGLVTTFPAITELTALLNGTAAQPNNSSAKSTIPLSWALNLTGNHTTSSAAVTLPWIIGYNSRGAPRLADQIAFFPHVTAIVPFSDGDAEGNDALTPRIALGAGIALAKAFTISVAWPIKGETETYLLLGISATDIADSFEAMK